MNFEVLDRDDTSIPIPTGTKTIVVVYDGSSPNETYKKADFLIEGKLLVITVGKKQTYINLDKVLKFTVE
jgi:hypothetical protein